MSLDLLRDRIKAVTVLFGSRALTRLTMESYRKSRRFTKVKYGGVGIIELAHDRLEFMGADLVRRRIATSSGTSIRRPAIPALAAVGQAVAHPGVRLTRLRYGLGGGPMPHRFYLRLRVADTPALMAFLARLAVRSAGERVFALRVNPSGFADRDRFPLVAQLQIQLRGGRKAPARLPYSFRGLGKRSRTEDPFTPVHR